MAWQTLKDQLKVARMVEHLISRNREVKILFDGEETEFTSKLIKIDHEDLFATTTSGSTMIIDKLQPDNGNAIIQSSKKGILEFTIADKTCRFPLQYVGISSSPPHFGFYLKLPEKIEIEDKRQNVRINYGVPDFVSAELRIGKGTKDDTTYNLNVINCSDHGLGLVITKNDFDLLKKLKVGDRIEEIMFFASWAMVKVNGFVKHITKIENGEHKGSYQLGIESKDLLDSCKPHKK